MYGYVFFFFLLKIARIGLLLCKINVPVVNVCFVLVHMTKGIFDTKSGEIASKHAICDTRLVGLT